MKRATVVEEVRFVDNGKIVMSAGVTTGMDAALHVVSKLIGEERAIETASRLEIRKAEAEDKEDLQSLYREAANWIRTSRGIIQWREETFTWEYIERFIHKNDVFIANLEGELVGCFSVHWQYEEIWGERYHDNAGYVHRLVVSRKLKGQGVGHLLLTWAEAYIKQAGKEWLRLDCMADNPALNQYYCNQGLILCGRIDGQGWSANLYERAIK